MAVLVAALSLASCDGELGSNESYTTSTFSGYNLITNLDDSSKPAEATAAAYRIKLNLNHICVDLTSSTFAIGSQTISFETDTMAYYSTYLVPEDGSGDYVSVGRFGKKSNVGKGATVTNLSGYITSGVYNLSSIYVPGFETAVYGSSRLILDYDLNDKYNVRTFWSSSFYCGRTDVAGKEGFYSYEPVYRVELNIEKNTAAVLVYNPAFSSSDIDMPKAIVFDDLELKYTHDSYYLESDAPTTLVLGQKDGVVALVESDEFKATGFSLRITDYDLTEVSIVYRIDGKSVNFNGSSIVQASK